MDLRLILSVTAAGLYAAALALLARLHAAAPRRDVIRDPVSDYGVGPTARLFGVYALLGTLGAGALAALFATEPTGAPASVPICLALMLPARLGVAALPTDLEGQPRTLRGRAHLLFAICSFALAYTAIANAAEPVAALGRLPAADGALIALKWAALASLVALVAAMPPPLRRLFGLAERAFIVSTTLWFLTMSLWFLLAGAA